MRKIALQIFLDFIANTKSVILKYVYVTASFNSRTKNWESGKVGKFDLKIK